MSSMKDVLENPPAFQREPPAMKFHFFLYEPYSIVFLELDLVSARPLKSGSSPESESITGNIQSN
jgi:hypothetical protein